MAQDAANAGEKWRFTWLRSFHDPISIRVWQSGSSYQMRAVRLARKKDDSVGAATADSTRLLTKDEVTEIQRLSSTKDLWLPLNETEVNAFSNGLDGVVWLFEHQKDKKHAMLDLWSPKDYGRKQYQEAGLDVSKIRDFDPYVRLGLYLLKITQLLPQKQDIY